MNSPLVSILVPIYGVESFIERCAISLFEQTYPNIEFIFVDDCSTDRSIDVLKATMASYPLLNERIKILHHDQNKGLAAARNTAVAAANGEFVWHVDSDDYVEITAVEKLIEKQQKENADIVLMEVYRKGQNYSYKITRGNFNTPKDWTLAFLSRKTFLSIWGGIFRRNLYVENSLEEVPGINMGEDYQILPRLTYYAKKISVLHEPLYNYVMLNENSFSNSYKRSKCEQYWNATVVLENFFKDKEYVYMESIEEGRVNICLEMLRSCTRVRGNDEAFKFFKEQLNSLNKKAFKQLKFPYKILSMIDNYIIMHWYVKIMGWIKRFFLTLKCRLSK